MDKQRIEIEPKIEIFKATFEGYPPPAPPYWFWNGLGWNYISNGWSLIPPERRKDGD